MTFLFFKLRKPDITEGDIVLFLGKHQPAERRNVITKVLSTPDHKVAIIRWYGTTMLVPQRELSVLKVDHGFPINIPQKPKAEICDYENLRRLTVSEGEEIPKGYDITGENIADFTPIPTNWFGYGLCSLQLGRDPARRLRAV